MDRPTSADSELKMAESPLASATPDTQLVLHEPPVELGSGSHTIHDGALLGGDTVPLYYLLYYFVLTRSFAYYAGNESRNNARRRSCTDFTRDTGVGVSAGHTSHACHELRSHDLY